MAGPREIDGRDIQSAAQFMSDVVQPCRPVVLRGLVSDWPVVRAAARSPASLRDYLVAFGLGSQVEAFFGPPAIAGKYYYSDDLKGFNFERRRMRFAEALVAIVERGEGAPTVYLGSVPAEDHMPGFSAANAMPLLPASAAARIWLGHAANVSPHYDAFDNLACVVAGTRPLTPY